MRAKIIAIVLMGTFLFAGLVFSDELTGKQIVEKMRDQEDLKTSLMQVRMTITDKRGDTRIREIINRVKDYPGGGKTVIAFAKPDDVKGTKFLIIENKNGDDEQLLYMPALKKVRRIASSQRSGSFMGTDFSYSDMQSHDPNKGTHTRLEDEAVDGQPCYKVQTVPNDADDYDYSKIIYWVKKDGDIPIKGEFYDKRGDLLKVLTVTKLEKDDKGHWIIKDTLMKNMQKDHSTRLEILQQKSDMPIADEFFSERFLTDETKL